MNVYIVLCTGRDCDEMCSDNAHIVGVFQKEHDAEVARKEHMKKDNLYVEIIEKDLQ